MTRLVDWRDWAHVTGGVWWYIEPGLDWPDWPDHHRPPWLLINSPVEVTPTPVRTKITISVVNWSLIRKLKKKLKLMLFHVRLTSWVHKLRCKQAKKHRTQTETLGVVHILRNHGKGGGRRWLETMVFYAKRGKRAKLLLFRLLKFPNIS